MDRLNFGLENDSNPFDFLPIEKGSTEKGMEKKLEAEKGLFVALNFPNHTKKMREFGAILTSLVTGPPRKGLLFLYISRFKARCSENLAFGNAFVRCLWCGMMGFFYFGCSGLQRKWGIFTMVLKVMKEVSNLLLRCGCDDEFNSIM